MPAHKGFSAWISIEGAVATEYSSRILKNEDKAECWIASEEGKHFQVHFQALEALPICSEHPKRGAVARLLVDGLCVRSYRCLQPPSTGTFDSIHASVTERKKLLFTTLNLTDKESHKDVPPDAAYGTIQIEIWEAELTGTGYGKLSIPVMPSRTVHETAKKAGGHCVGFGETSTFGTSGNVTSKFHRIKMLVTFSFYYQPLDVLQANGTAPRPTPKPATTNTIAPPPSILEAPVDDAGGNESTDEECKFIRLSPLRFCRLLSPSCLVQDQMTQLQARLDALSDRRKNGKRKRTAVKQENSNVPSPSNRAAKKVKLENAKVSRLRPGEVIDLTID